MAKEVSSKNTKAEILEAYHMLIKENRELQGKMEELRRAKKAVVPERPQAKEAKPLAEVVAGATINDVIQGLGHLQARFGSAIHELSAKLTTEATKLEELRQVVEGETTQLEELHGLEVMENTLEALIQKYVEQSERFEEEMDQKRQAFEQEMTDKRNAWQNEQEAHTRFIKERNESLKKARQREAAEYRYELERTRKQDADEYEQNKRRLNEELDEFAQKRKKEWQERENAIAEQEKVFEEYRENVEAFPRKLDAAVKKASEEGRRLVESEAKIQADLRAKEVKGEKRIYELRIHALEETIKKQATQVESLSKQLNVVLKQGQDLAVKALEGASSAHTYQAVREIALEQAKNLPTNE